MTNQPVKAAAADPTAPRFRIAIAVLAGVIAILAAGQMSATGTAGTAFQEQRR